MYVRISFEPVLLQISLEPVIDFGWRESPGYVNLIRSTAAEIPIEWRAKAQTLDALIDAILVKRAKRWRQEREGIEQNPVENKDGRQTETNYGSIQARNRDGSPARGESNGSNVSRTVTSIAQVLMRRPWFGYRHGPTTARRDCAG